jgi:hypothetical protein
MAEFNYFNFYTEVEEYFWRKRGSHILISPLDWALLETWQMAGIPVEAVLKGIDRAFESHARSRRGAGGQPLKSLVYCSDAVLEAATEAREAAAGQGPRESRKTAVPFPRRELRAYFERNDSRLRAAAEKQRTSLPNLAKRLEETAGRLNEMKELLDESNESLDLEDLERRLTIQEEKLSAALTADAPEEVLLGIRRDMDRALGRYRHKMDAAQREQIEKQYEQKRLYEEFGIPRLSLFYLV